MEERIVVGDPVEGRRREDGIDQPIDRQRSTEVGDDVLDAIPEAFEPRVGGVDHGR